MGIVSVAEWMALIGLCALVVLLLFFWREQKRKRQWQLKLGRLLEAPPEEEALEEKITSLKGKIAGLERHAKVLSSLFEALKEGVILAREQGEILFSNPRALELLGVSRKRAGLKLQELLREEEFWQAFARKEAKVLEIELFWPLPRTLELTLLPLGEGFIGLILQDITPFRRLSDLRRDFVSYLSHEIRTPLTAIEGYTEHLLEEIPPPWKEELKVIRRNAKRLSRLVKDLQVLSRLELQGIPREELEELDLREVLHAALEIVYPAAQGKEIEIVSSFPNEEAFLQGSFDDLVRAVVNLLDNAVKFSPPRGKIFLSLRQEDASWHLSIRDQGPGIPALEKERVFERFYRGRRGDRQGSGLGLSIVKHIVLAHGGRIELESEPGEGTTFHLFFPLSGTKA